MCVFIVGGLVLAIVLVFFNHPCTLRVKPGDNILVGQHSAGAFKRAISAGVCLNASRSNEKYVV